MSSRTSCKPLCPALGGLCLLLFACRAGATTLDLDFVDTDGRPVDVAKAELLAVGWGAFERIALDTDGHTMRLPMDADWLRSRLPLWFDYQEGVYLYLQAPPLASIRSERFKWLGAGANPGPVTIGFPNGVEVVVEDASETQVVVRRYPTHPLEMRVSRAGSPQPVRRW